MTLSNEDKEILEIFGTSEKEIVDLYNHTDGFLSSVNSNHPERRDGETFDSFLHKEHDILLDDNSDTIREFAISGGVL